MFGEVSTGARNDLQRATDMARSMVTEYGMTDRFGPRSLRSEPKSLFLGGGFQGPAAGMEPISEATQREVDEEVGKILEAEAGRVKDLLARRRNDLDSLADELLEKETISGDDLRSALGTDLGDSRAAANYSKKI